jgi:hypothetical protein
MAPLSRQGAAPHAVKRLQLSAAFPSVFALNCTSRPPGTEAMRRPWWTLRASISAALTTLTSYQAIQSQVLLHHGSVDGFASIAHTNIEGLPSPDFDVSITTLTIRNSCRPSASSAASMANCSWGCFDSRRCPSMQSNRLALQPSEP